jgi:hypothetical protein
VNWIWAISVLLQSVLFVLLLATGNFKKLRFLTTYVILNLCQAAFVFFEYSRVGANLEHLKRVLWFSEAITLLFQALAAIEAIRLVLEPYSGIWGLAWRTLTAVCAILIVYVGAHTASNYDWALLEAERGYHLIFAIAVIACFLLIRYYTITIPSAYKLLLGGFCFYSCVMVLVTTLFQSVWWGSQTDYQTIWGFSSVLAFAVAQVPWIAAVRRPLPVDERRRALPSDDIYQHWGPQIDERLRVLNEKLMRIWKLEARF